MNPGSTKSMWPRILLTPRGECSAEAAAVHLSISLGSNAAAVLAALGAEGVRGRGRRRLAGPNKLSFRLLGETIPKATDKVDFRCRP